MGQVADLPVRMGGLATRPTFPEIRYRTQRAGPTRGYFRRKPAAAFDCHNSPTYVYY